jgi:hypothetical protein
MCAWKFVREMREREREITNDSNMPQKTNFLDKTLPPLLFFNINVKTFIVSVWHISFTHSQT